MSDGKRGFVVCARLERTEAPHASADAVMAGQPAVRRLNRMERVALAYDGRLARRTDRMLLVAFNTAHGAVLGACEMQRRCADLPQVSGDTLALRIGIHKASPQRQPRLPRPSLLKPVERRDLKRRFGFEVALQLADRAPDNGIVVSGLAAGALAPTLLEASPPERDVQTDLPVHVLNWHQVLMRSILTPIAVKAPLGTFVLSRGGQRLELGPERSTVAFGRDPGCDVVLAHPFASRLHARIELRADGCVLTDQSANGTCVQMPNGLEVLIRDKAFRLPESGRLAFGHSIRKAPDAVFDFELAAT